MLLSQKTQGDEENPGRKNVHRVLRFLLGTFSGLVLAVVFQVPAYPQTTHNITIGWTYTQGTDLAIGFNIYRATVSGGPYGKQTTSPLPIATLSYVDTNGTGGTKYFYVVTAIDSSGVESVNSSEVSATFLASSPNAPTGITATAH